jgi:hypothetical protein
MSEDRCPRCGLLITTILDLQAHLKAVERDQAHADAVYVLIGVDAARIRAEDRADAEERARALGWRLV